MITSLDLQRITHLLIDRLLVGKLDVLNEKLDQTQIVESEKVSRDLVTMNSEVAIHDLTNKEKMKLRLVYQLSPLYGNQTSILSPLGTVLLGMRVNEVASYKLRDGSSRQIKLEEIVYQPEANGHFDL